MTYNDVLQDMKDIFEYGIDVEYADVMKEKGLTIDDLTRIINKDYGETFWYSYNINYLPFWKCRYKRT